jgi:hypothetical protein
MAEGLFLFVADYNGSNFEFFGHRTKLIVNWKIKLHGLLVMSHVKPKLCILYYILVQY